MADLSLDHLQFILQEASGKDVPYVLGPRREGDVAVCYADCTKAKEVLGWVATRTLQEMCQGEDTEP